MGRATIIDGGDAGLYRVRYDLSAQRINNLREHLQQRITAIGADIEREAVTRDLIQSEVDSASATLNAFIDEWIEAIKAGTDPDPPIDPSDVDNDDPAAADPSGLIAAHNAHRSALGLSALSQDSALMAAAQSHADFLAINDTTGHIGFNGSQPQQRITAQGYDWMDGGAVSENVATGQEDVARVMNAWLASSGHRANIERADMQDIGYGYNYRAGSRFRHFWVVCFGRKA